MPVHTHLAKRERPRHLTRLRYDEHAWRLSSVLLMAAAFCVTTDASAADHLTPCADGLQDYYAQIETRIRQAAPDEALWKITVFPPFQAE